MISLLVVKKAVTNASFVGKRNQHKLKFRHFKRDNCEGPHKTNEYPEFQQWLKNKKNKNGTKNYKTHGPQTAWVAFVDKQVNLSKNDWYFDTGCTQHISHDLSLFTELIEGSENDFGYTDGIGGKSAIKCIGTVDLRHVVLYDVAYVPDGRVNLISVKMTSTKSNMKFVFDTDSPIIDNITEYPDYCWSVAFC